MINVILDAPGAVITTATRPDNIAATPHPTSEAWPIAVFDPQRLAEALPAGSSLVIRPWMRGPLTAMIRAISLAFATGLESGGFWEGKTRAALQALLHAAALDQRNPSELFAGGSTTNSPPPPRRSTCTPT